MMRLSHLLAIAPVLSVEAGTLHLHRHRDVADRLLERPRVQSTRVPLSPAPVISSKLLSSSITTNAAISSATAIANVIHRESRTVTITITYTMTRTRAADYRMVLTTRRPGRTRISPSVSRRPLTMATTTNINTAPTVTKDLSDLDYISKVLEAHNLHRRNHSAPDLVYDSALAASAAKIAATCVYQHDTSSCASGCGQNIGAGYTNNCVGSFVGSMYNNEINEYPGPYGYNNIDMSTFSSWGHYSQIVWMSTTKVGCATQYCPGGLAKTGYGIQPYFTVCNYYPAGNVVGQWSQVPAPDGGDTVIIIP